MNILCISKDFSGGDLFYRMKNEGNSVKVFVEDKAERCHFENMLKKVENWNKELNWVGKDGLIVFDSIGYGKIQDELRLKGYSVVGGCESADKLEHDRQYGQKILHACGIRICPSINFLNAKDAIKFLKKHKGPWVIKQNGHVDKTFNYVGELQNNLDSIELLKLYCRNNKDECASIDLQKKIEGIEIGIGRYFNGNTWVGPIEINLEHKSLANDDLGPKTYEMGTLMWYESKENTKLYQETLVKLQPYLEAINFKGDIEINCIINEKGMYPIELTARFGFPSTQLQSRIHRSPWGEFLKAVADGKNYDLEYEKGYGIIILVATPPFPYVAGRKKYYPHGVEIYFKNKLTKKELRQIHFEEVSIKKKRNNHRYIVSSKNGYVLHVSGMGKSIELARKDAYELIDKIIIPKKFFRTDIGLKFSREQRASLKKWGWIKV